ncbi:MAG: T9SS type A sorting domain-containing protein [Bacteroidales bacterium]|nr:T9SS type A sorting domain-containing protein [Bacteroidales bacterium]
MKNLFLLFAISCCLSVTSVAQELILEENFGSSAFDGNPADYTDYTSDAIFSGDDSHAFTVANSSGYDQASGGVAVYMGNWNADANTEFVLQCSTEGYISVRLSFGMTHNTSGWGTCQLTNNYTLVEYSTDSTNWISMDKAYLLDGSSWPCADDDTWSFIKLAGLLPASPTLYIRFTHTSPSIHPYSIDDIIITGFMPDYDSPSVPENLNAQNIELGSFIMSWNASQDAGGINVYKIFKDGKYLMSTMDTVAEIKYQFPGSSAGFSVIAYDIADNASEESVVLPVTFLNKPLDYTYSWESPHAKVLPSGEMEWQPKEFAYKAGVSVRYIDFENGDDANDGLSKSTPWKHHPWDRNARLVSANTQGIHTYVFKRGVIYRGQLIAEGSGTPLEPIRLTSDPSWGEGKAWLFGSVRLGGGWKKADELQSTDVPNPEQVWYKYIEILSTKMVCELDGETFKELNVARSPNYKYTPDDPLKSWYTWTSKSTASGGVWLRDSKNLTQENSDYYTGATVFSQEDAIVMCTVWKQDVSEWDPSLNRVKVASSNFGGKGCHYFIENTPFLLDTTNEFYYDRIAKRMYLRLDNDKNPNNAVLEAAIESELIRIDNKHDIEISGLSFGMTTAHQVRYGQADAISAVRISGICSNIDIKNNLFQNVVGGVSVNNNGSEEVNTHSISVTDNNLQNISDLAIVFSTNTIYLDDINILRNNIYNNGYRHQGRFYSSIPAIYGQLNYGEVAGNIIDVSWGNGIDVFWGKGSGSDRSVSFIRGLIHHNSASNTLIGTNDYGGIESWQGGPSFCYNNNSHNASGYKHYNNSSIGYAYYFDGSFKHIVFNNIASGVSHNRNSAAIMQVLGYYNMYVHNSAYNTNIFFNAWKDALAVCGHNTYLSNVAQDIPTFFKQEIYPENLPYDAYGFNVSSGYTFSSALENLNDNLSLADFEASLVGYNSQLTQTGYNASEDIILNAKIKDFRPVENSTAVDKGVKFFTAFPLSKVVGEWNFYRHPADLNIIMGDNFYMTEDFINRETYKDVMKNHLQAHNVSDEHFVEGKLEDWTHGALTFDGTVYCSLEDALTRTVKSNNVDMSDNDFILEGYLRTEKGHTDGVILSKFGSAEGYELGINENGEFEMSLLSSGSEIVSRISSSAINDSLWHHVLIEVDRYGTIDMYVDGSIANGILTGAMPDIELSLSNKADLLIGKDADDNYFLGTIDFLRISKGSLYSAKTTVDEIYSWETDGPFLYDILGNEANGKRDAGAIETTDGCELTVSDIMLEMDSINSTMEFTASSTDGIVVKAMDGDFFSFEIFNDTVKVSVSDNPYIDERQGSLKILGCGGYKTLLIKQAAGPCVFYCETDSVEVSFSQQTIEVQVVTNDEIAIGADQGDFVNATAVAPEQVVLVIEENLSIENRITEIEIEGCDGTHSIIVVQEGAPCVFTCDIDTLEVSHLQQELSIHVNTNSYFTVAIVPESFMGILSGPDGDSVVINIAENNSAEARTTVLTLDACGLSHAITVIQEGVVGILNTYQDCGLEIYPNPVSDGLMMLKLPEDIQLAEYTIADLSGKLVQNGEFYNNNAPIQLRIKTGTYILNVIGDKNVYRGRLVVI